MAPPSLGRGRGRVTPFPGQQGCRENTMPSATADPVTETPPLRTSVVPEAEKLNRWMLGVKMKGSLV